MYKFILPSHVTRGLINTVFDENLGKFIVPPDQDHEKVKASDVLNPPRKRDTSGFSVHTDTSNIYLAADISSEQKLGARTAVLNQANQSVRQSNI